MGFIYTPNMPVASHFPSDDQGPMNQNFQYTNSFGTRDHQFTGNSGNVNDGIHKQVTLAAQTTPGFTGGTGVMYANTANTDTQLFYNNSSGNIQLTTIKTGVPTLASTGCTFLPGGLLLQWGSDTKNIGSPTTFPVAFSSTAYVVMLTPTGATTSAQGLLSISSKSTTNFTIGNFTGILTSYSYLWMAIGPA